MPGGRAVLRFVVGCGSGASGTGDDRACAEHVAREHRDHGDMLLLDRFDESYSRLAHKLAAALEWAAGNEPRAGWGWVLKTDDDSFVRVDRLVETLELFPPDVSRQLHWGMWQCGSPVVYGHLPGSEVKPSAVTDGDPDWWLSDHYLPYPNGAGYLVSWPVLRTIAKNAQWYARYAAEDATLGLWLAPFNLSRVHDRRFWPWRAGCSDSWILQHHLSPAEVTARFDTLCSTAFLSQCPGGEEEPGMMQPVFNWDRRPPGIEAGCQRRSGAVRRIPVVTSSDPRVLKVLPAMYTTSKTRE